MQIQFIPVGRFIEVFLDEKKYAQLYRPFFEKELQGVCFLSKEELDAWIGQKEIFYGKRYVYYLLSKKNYLTNAIKEKLHLRKISKEAIETIIDFLLQNRFVDDEHWIEKFIMAKWQKGYGKKAIYYALLEKKVSPITIKKQIAWITTSKEKEQIALLLKKKGLRDKKKASSFLQRRGFSFEAIASYVEEN